MDGNNEVVRKKLIQVLDNYGVKLVFIARQLGWNYENLISFKNGNRPYGTKRLKELMEFLNKYK